MNGRRGLTIVELTAVVSIIALLAAIVLPSLGHAKELARRAVCATQMRGVHTALSGYAADAEGRLPPFMFSDHQGDLPVSGHWGGATQETDPAAFGRIGWECVNLAALVREDRTTDESLICPSAGDDLAGRSASYFPYSPQFSTYCLRFPCSEDLFRRSPRLAYYYGGPLLSIYRMRAGGQPAPAGAGTSRAWTIPQVRIDRVYRTAGQVSCGDGDFFYGDDVVLADVFARRDYRVEAPAEANLDAWPVRWDRCHANAFNTLTGGGAVRLVEDDGTVAMNTRISTAPPADDGAHGATSAERVWQFFDAAP